MSPNLFDVLAITAPFFGLIACGYGAGRGRLLTPQGTVGLNRFVFYFALPALLFSSMESASLGEILNWPFIATYVGIGLLMFGLAAGLGRLLFRATPGEMAILGLAACFSNIGVMGLPLLLAARGESVGVPLALIVAVDTVFFVPLTMFILEMGRGNGGRWQRFGTSVARVTVGNPVVLAIVAGALMSAEGLHSTGAVARFVDLLAHAAGPCALVGLGASLSERPVAGHLGAAAFMTMFKLAVHPAAIWLIMAGVGVDPQWTAAATLGLAMPIAIILFVLAHQYDVFVEQASAAVLISTVASLASVTMLLALVGPA